MFFFGTKDPQILRNQMIPWSFNKTPVVLGSRVWFSFETKPTWWPPVPPLQLWLKTLRALQQGMEKQSTVWTLGMATGYKINTIYIIYTLYIYQHVYRWYMYLLSYLLIYSFIHVSICIHSQSTNHLYLFSKLRPYFGGFKLLVATLRIVYWRGSPTEGDGLCWKVSSPVVDAFWRFVSLRFFSEDLTELFQVGFFALQDFCPGWWRISSTYIYIFHEVQLHMILGDPSQWKDRD